jgi:DNA-binding transcriptional regulator YdaS (Cro superfamily)
MKTKFREGLRWAIVAGISAFPLLLGVMSGAAYSVCQIAAAAFAEGCAAGEKVIHG